MSLGPPSAPERREGRALALLFALAALFHLWGATVEWDSLNLPGGEFRQAQTAISTYYIQREDNFSLAYPTPVLGKPWSIPMEFPLYQWTVAVLSTGTGLDLTQAGRAVSLACFYLALPAVFLLLGHLGVAPARRLAPLGLILTCPLYVYYARAFLIETMALMFSVWFLLAFIRALEKGGRWWLVLANVAGIGAGLVKVTTFLLYLLPAAAWGLWLLRRARAAGRDDEGASFGPTLRSIAAATLLPFAVTLWWIGFADATKALNPSADFLRSANLNGFNFGAFGTRFSGEIWHSWWTVLRQNLAWPPVLAACLLAVGLLGRRWWPQFLLCLGVYAGVQLIFPQLYAWHDYYSVANGMLLMVALGFGLLALLESRLPRGIVLPAIALGLAGQAGLYWNNAYQTQRHPSPGGSGLTAALGYLTRSDESIVVAGDDWSSIIPYYAQRRALMFRYGREADGGYITAAFASLAGETVGAVILPHGDPAFAVLLARAVAELGIDARPVLRWHDYSLYLSAATRLSRLAHMRETSFYEVSWEPGSEPAVERLAGAWRETARLRPEQRISFRQLSPQPVRFFSQFGPGQGSRFGADWLNCHPDTRLRFALPAGAHHLRAEVLLDAAAYDAGVPAQDRSDGVNFDVNVLVAGRPGQRLLTRGLDPANRPEDRGPQVIALDFTLEAAAEVELAVGPGPNGNFARDWALLGPVKFD